MRKEGEKKKPLKLMYIKPSRSPRQIKSCLKKRNTRKLTHFLSDQEIDSD